MKRVLALLSVAGLLFVSCRPDVIEITDNPVDTSEIDNDDDNDPTEAEGDGDLIDGVSFGRTIGIVWNGSSVSVSGDDNGVVSVNGAGVTVDNRSHDEIVRFELSGSSSNGFLKIYGIRKQALVLKGLELTNKSGAAINNQSHKRTFVVLEGSNKLSDGTVTASGDYTDQSAGEDCKAAFFSEGQLVFSGGGSLEVEASGKGAITSDDYLRFLGTRKGFFIRRACPSRQGRHHGGRRNHKRRRQRRGQERAELRCGGHHQRRQRNRYSQRRHRQRASDH